MKKRENSYVRIILEPAKSRIENNQCPSCGLPKEQYKRRKDWLCCSSKCTSDFENYCIIRNWRDLRLKCFIRDGFTCVKCGKYYTQIIDLVGLGDILSKTLINEEKKENRLVQEQETYYIKKSSENLIADHILPIALDGEQWDLNNLQTLCECCNKIKTKEDAKNIAQLRRKERLLKGNKTL